MGHHFFFKNGPNGLCLRHLTFFNVEVKLNQSENQLFQATITLIFKEKTQPKLFYHFLKLILESGTSLSPGAFKNGKKNALNV